MMSSRPRTHRLHWILLGMILAVGACREQGGKSTEPGKAGVAPERLVVAPTVLQPGVWPDRSEEAAQRTPWDNYQQKDDLHAAWRSAGGAPAVAPPGWERFTTDPLGVLLRTGKVNYAIVHRLYQEGVIARERAGEIVSELDKRVEASGDPTLRANLILALIHIGFDEAAFQQIERWKDAAWFQKNWDVNFYAGTLLFRHRRHAEAVPFLKAARKLHPEPWVNLWLSLAEKRPELFPFGAHMGAGDAGTFPFRDVADRLGIRRWHLAGALAFFDMNNDTLVDWVANGVHATPELYVQEAGRGFVRREDAALGTVSNVPAGCIAADFDNDGYTDLYMTRAAWFSKGPNRLLQNVQGTHFVERSTESDAGLSDQNSCGAAALDYDRDGLLDLIVSGTAGGSLRVLHNRGDFHFEDVTQRVGVAADQSIAVSAAVGDVNADGWPDVFVNTQSPLKGEPARDARGPNLLYLNDGKGRFHEVAEERGVAHGTPQGFASWMFDIDNDGDLDIFASNLTDEEFADILGGFQEARKWEGHYRGSAVYINDGRGYFVNRGEEMGIVPSSVMGAQFIDFDLDGWLDVVLGPGSHPLQNMQPLFFYRNEKGRALTNITPLTDPLYHGKFHGIAFTDYDRDGDPDLYVNNGGVLLSDRWRDLFLENTTTGRHWLHLRLRGTSSNAGAVGARVTLRLGEGIRMQEVGAGQGFASTNGPGLIFGLGAVDVVDEIHIRWPSGRGQVVSAVAADQALVITEGSDALQRIY